MLKAVDDLTLEIQEGEFFGFLGPNGAGKTTTIKMMTGLLSPSNGTILLDGIDIYQNPIKAKQIIGYVPDQPFLYDKLTGREFFYFVGGLYSLSKDFIRQKIDQLIEQFEIGSWIDKLTEDYSQGMRQRIVICAALLHDPKIIVIDEPMIGLDPRSAKIVKEVLKQKTIQEHVTIFMSTHSLSVAEELCTRVGIINHGRLIYDVAIEELNNTMQSSNNTIEDVFLELTSDE